MNRCANINCDNVAVDSPNRVCVTVDGDFACDEHCKAEYVKQRDHFLAVTAQSEKLTADYLMGR